MGRKRKGVGANCGRTAKARKVVQPKKRKECTWLNEEEIGVLAIKVSAETAIRPEFVDLVIPWLEKTSILSTYICELASLLYLNKMKAAYEHGRDTGDWSFFDDPEADGVHIIEGCFYAVLQDYKEAEDMLPEFREKVEGLDAENRFAWPGNPYFGNHFKYLFQQYARNVVTNLTTHAKKRLNQYLRLTVWAHNINEPDDRFDQRDIDNALSWAIKRYDSTRNDPERIAKRHRLLEHVREIGGPEDHDIAMFTRNDWHASMRMWLHMQDQISRYHDELQANNLADDERVPKIKNLSVIPICSHMRKAVKVDADVLYRMMCETRLIPKDEHGCQYKVGDITSNKEFYFAQIFNMEKINRILRANKQFHCHIVSDGVSASILYKVPLRVLKELDNDELVKQKYEEGQFIYELGIDPGMKTWNATVRRHIATGKEVFMQLSFDSI